MDIAYCKQQLKRMIVSKQIANMKNLISDEDAIYIIEQAKQLEKHIFTFDKPWDMERCVKPYQIEPLDFRAQRNDDEEWCFMLNRMDYLNYLMLADVIGEQHRYVQVGKQLLFTWISQHSDLQPDVSTRTLDTGIRIMNIMEMLPYVYAAHELQDDELETILNSMVKQIEYLRKQYIAKYTLSNWGSIQTCAILSVLPLLDENYQEHPIFLWAKDEIKTQFAIQIYDDGMHWEQSTMYHIEVLNYAMKLLYYQRHYGFELDGVESGCYQLCDALFYQMTPRKEIEAFGDSDRCSIQDVVTRAAILFHQSIWKAKGYKEFDIESLYSLGCKLAGDYKVLEATMPQQVCFDGIDSGMYCMRSNWQSDASFTMFTHGSLGSGHGHSDNLHVSLYYKGKPYLIDSGRYTYRDDHPLRALLKGMKAHNSVLIDECEYCLPKDSWTYHAFGLPIKSYVVHKENLHYIEASMIGNNPLQVWTRKVVIIDPCIWMIVDEVKQDGKHCMVQRFHLDPEVKAKSLQNGFKIGQLTLHSKCDLKQEVQPCSLRYNELLDHDVLLCSQTFQDKGQAITSICPNKMLVETVPILQNGDSPIDCSIAQARKYHISDTESYTIIIFHEEVYQGKKICFCEGVALHAKAVVIHTVAGKKDSCRLKS